MLPLRVVFVRHHADFKLALRDLIIARTDAGISAHTVNLNPYALNPEEAWFNAQNTSSVVLNALVRVIKLSSWQARSPKP